MAFYPTIPGERGGRRGEDAEVNRLESQTGRQLSIPRQIIPRMNIPGESGSVFTNGIAISAALTTGKNTVVHGLGRSPVGIIPYHSDASGLVPGLMYSDKSGDLVLSGANAWNDVTGWSETDPYGAFNATTGVFTFPCNGIYTLNTVVCYDSMADASDLAVQFLHSSGYAVATYWPIGAINSPCIGVDWSSYFTASSSVKVQAYRNVAARSVDAVTGGGNHTVFNVTPHRAVDAYAWDATNIYVHSDYDHTRNFWVF